MSSFLRERLGLTQERLASWLGISRISLAHSEGGRRGLPLGSGIKEARLTMAVLGKVLDIAQPDASPPAPPPLPPPPVDPEPLRWRLRECEHDLYRLRRQLTALDAQATCCTNRLAALPALRAYAGPVKNPAREAGWLALLEGEAVDGLRDACGPGPRTLLAARIAGLERESEVIGALLAQLGEQPPG